METKITLVLDAQKYHAELDKVIQSARTSAASIASAAATTVFVAHGKKYDMQHRIFKMTDADAAKKILDRTGELAEEYLRKTE